MRVAVGITLLMFFVLPFSCPVKGDSLEGLLERGGQAYSNNDLSLARNLFTEAYRIDSSNTKANAMLCVVNNLLEYYAESLAFCRHLVSEMPANEAAQHQLWISETGGPFVRFGKAQELGDFETSLDAAKSIIRANSSVPTGYSLVGLAYSMRDMGKDDRLLAVAHFRESLKLHSQLPAESSYLLDSASLASTHSVLGLTYLREDDCHLAIEHLSKALEIDPATDGAEQNLSLARRCAAAGKSTGTVWLSLADLIGAASGKLER